MRSPGWPTSASRQPGYEKRIVVSAGFCGAGAAMPAESNCWYSLAVSRIKNRQGLRRRKFIRSAARNKWEASFVRVHRADFILPLFYFTSLLIFPLSSPLFFNSSVRFVLYFFPFLFFFIFFFSFLFFWEGEEFLFADWGERVSSRSFDSGREYRIIGSFKVELLENRIRASNGGILIFLTKKVRNIDEVMIKRGLLKEIFVWCFV